VQLVVERLLLADLIIRNKETKAKRSANEMKKKKKPNPSLLFCRP